MYSFPNYLTDNDYEGMQKLLVHLSSSYEKIDKNRSMAAKKTNPFDSTMQNYEYLSEIIKNLKSEGAFLS